MTSRWDGCRDFKIITASCTTERENVRCNINVHRANERTSQTSWPHSRHRLERMWMQDNARVMAEEFEFDDDEEDDDDALPYGSSDDAEVDLKRRSSQRSKLKETR